MTGMSHEAFREMSWYYIGRWRDNQPEVGGALRMWMWYRTHPANAVAKSDDVGPPEHADWVCSVFPDL
jgi:glucan endo-1,3-alpha-glucosidase